ncbi:hypothetical protein QBZ16_002753 [Prototheca wickerhamii]|uniref:dihydrolipoyllysine-residue succinyltransferase n=1 Tax=Prototheca wickerhamii TaxID=3111 RepID=A0AAD9IK65_PROWI|nr:hypothetical protein QBZ16_002753 [Prototheca wickerhamii]
MVATTLGLSSRRGAQAALRALRHCKLPRQAGTVAYWSSFASRDVGSASGALLTAGRASSNVLPGASAGSFALRAISTSSAALADLTVEVPSMGESISEGTVAQILVQPGETVEEDGVLATLDTDKVSMDIKYPSKTPGVVKEYKFAEGDTVSVGDVFAIAEAGPPAPGRRPERRVKMTRLRARVAERLKNSQNTYAMLTTFNEVDMTSLMEMRSAHKDRFLEKHGVKMGFMSAFVKAAANALETVPAVNGVIDGGDIVYRDYYDISVAVATPKGLVVPVLRNVDQMSFATVEKTINELGKKAREGTLSIDEMAGGTFTISNGGVFGSMLSTPIINPPQSAILGMHATNVKPAVVNGQIVARPMMYLALTYDHRLIDGREAVTFLKRIKEIIEDPRRLLLDV